MDAAFFISVTNMLVRNCSLNSPVDDNLGKINVASLCAFDFGVISQLIISFKLNVQQNTRLRGESTFKYCQAFIFFSLLNNF